MPQPLQFLAIFHQVSTLSLKTSLEDASCSLLLVFLFEDKEEIHGVDVTSGEAGT